MVVDGLANELGRHKLEYVEAPPSVGESPEPSPAAAPAAPAEEVKVPEPSTPAPAEEAPEKDTLP